MQMASAIGNIHQNSSQYATGVSFPKPTNSTSPEMSSRLRA